MKHIIDSAMNAVEQRLLGKSHEVRLAVACLLSGGHLLLEDLPGMGKTTLAHALAEAMGLSYSRPFNLPLISYPQISWGCLSTSGKQRPFDFSPGLFLIKCCWPTK